MLRLPLFPSQHSFRRAGTARALSSFPDVGLEGERTFVDRLCRSCWGYVLWENGAKRREVSFAI